MLTKQDCEELGAKPVDHLSFEEVVDIPYANPEELSIMLEVAKESDNREIIGAIGLAAIYGFTQESQLKSSNQNTHDPEAYRIIISSVFPATRRENLILASDIPNP